MTRITIATPILLAALALGGCDLQTATTTYTPPQTTTPIRKVITNLDIGDVTVRPSTAGSILVQADSEWITTRPTVDFKLKNSIVYVTADCPDVDPQCRVDVTLSIPLTMDFEVAGEETKIAAAGLDGAATLTTKIGDIMLADLAGKLALKVGEGQIRGDALTSGNVTASIDEEGPATLDFVAGAEYVAVTSNNGTIRMTVPPTSYRVDASTGDGDLDIDVVQSSSAKRHLVAQAVRGDVSIQPRLPHAHEPVDLKVGQTTQFADEPISLTFDRVVEDSRCPSGVLCPWAGRFIASMTVTGADGSKRTADVTLDDPETIFGYSVQLTDVLPALKAGESQPAAQDYIITVAIERI